MLHELQFCIAVTYFSSVKDNFNPAWYMIFSLSCTCFFLIQMCDRVFRYNM